MRITALFAAALATALSAGSVGAAELISNGGFETGSFAGWTQGGNLSFTTVTPSAAASGGFGASLGPFGSDGTLSQALASVVAGQNYTLAFDLRSVGSGDNDFSLSFGGVLVTSLVNSAQFPYQHFSFVRTAPSNGAAVTFSFLNNPSFWNLDNVSVTSVSSGGGGGIPEPGAWALMIGGFAAVGAALRRRSAAA